MVALSPAEAMVSIIGEQARLLRERKSNPNDASLNPDILKVAIILNAKGRVDPDAVIDFEVASRSAIKLTP